MILQVLIAMVVGWVKRHQQQVIAYLSEEYRVLKRRRAQRNRARSRATGGRRARSVQMPPRPYTAWERTGGDGSHKSTVTVERWHGPDDHRSASSAR